MIQQIKSELARLESENEIKIIYSIEPGSRAWGFASTGSGRILRFMKKIIVFIISLFTIAIANSQSLDSSLKISHLTGDFYIYTTYSTYKGIPYPANGMYVVSPEGVAMFDSPWDTTQFQPLLDSIYKRHQQKVIFCIATHFHEDRTAGLEYYRKKGIKTYTTMFTDSLSLKHGMKRAEFLIGKDMMFSLGKYRFQTYYPGHGHAPDNIVIWFEKEKILYGGCLIKSVDDKTLGNLSDANVSEYPKTLKKLIKKFGSPRFVIPGHNSWTDPGSLKHTFRMAEEISKDKR